MFSLFPDKIWRNDILMEKEEVLVRIEFSKFRNFGYFFFSMLLNKGSLKNLQYSACYNQRKPFSSFSWLLNYFQCTRRNKTANYSVVHWQHLGGKIFPLHPEH